MCVCLWRAKRGRWSDPLELEWHVCVSHLTSMMGNKVKYSQCSSSCINFPRQQVISLYACYCRRVYCLPQVSKKQKWQGSKIMPTLSSKYFVIFFIFCKFNYVYILCVPVYTCIPCACKDLQTSEEALNALDLDSQTVVYYHECLQLNLSPLQKTVNIPVESTFQPVFKKSS